MEDKILKILNDGSIPPMSRIDAVNKLLNPSINPGDRLEFIDGVSYIVTCVCGQLYCVNLDTGNAFPIKHEKVRDIFDAYPGCKCHIPRD